MINKVALVAIVGLTAVSCGGKKKKKSSSTGIVTICEEKLVEPFEKAEAILNPTGPYHTPYNNNKILDSTKAKDLLKLLDEMKAIRSPEAACRISADEDAKIYNEEYVEEALKRIPENLK